MKRFLTIHDSDIRALEISPRQCVEWVKEAFLHKRDVILSPKISQKPTQDSFFNTMPCCVPTFNHMGVKVVSRLPGNEPPLKSVVNLFDLSTGDLIAVLEANWITAMRTGAVATLAAQTFMANFREGGFGFVGLGSTASAIVHCLASLLYDKKVDIWLLEYKGRASTFASKFGQYNNLVFHIAKNKEELVENTKALFSCVTVMNEQFLPPSSYPTGYTCIPVHTKGFQDCDLEFDRIFGDDYGHIEEFKNFKKFRTFGEIGDVLMGRIVGRTSDTERILSYNVGIGLHDVWFASNIYKLFVEKR